MSDLSTIVDISIDVQTQSIARATFGVPGIIGVFTTAKTTPAFSRAREYANLEEMKAEGWSAVDAVYLAAKSLFSQDPCPNKVVIGRRDAADADWETAFTAIQAENDDWYTFGIIPTASGTADAEIEEVGAWVITQKKIFFGQTSAAGSLDGSATTDPGAELLAAVNKRVALMYRASGKLGEYTHLGWLGEGLPFPIGSSQWAYKTPVGSTSDKLTGGQKSAAFAKNINTFTTVGGVSVTEKGKTSGGEWIDVVMGIDWLEANLQEEIYSALINTRKLPYDDGGFQVIAGIVQMVLERAAAMGILQLKSISVTVPKYADISQADKQARKLPGVTFRALLEGAILTTEIRGTVSY